MAKAELLTLVESQEIEFKKSLSLQQEALEALCAMVNSDRGSGKVIFGVAPDGVPVGVDPGNLDAAQRKLVERAKQGFDPPLHLTIDIVDCEGNKLLAVEAVRSPSVPVHEFDGRAFIREGSAKRRLGVAERTALVSRRNRGSHPGPWRCDRCGTTVGTLMNYDFTASGATRSYACDCGGEFWPAG